MNPPIATIDNPAPDGSLEPECVEPMLTVPVSTHVEIDNCVRSLAPQVIAYPQNTSWGRPR